jgi:hypothetical protein
MDFMTDRRADGRQFRVLTFVNHVRRVSPAIAVGGSPSGPRVAAVVAEVART